MTLTTELATIRAAFRRELLRLHARPFEGGPMHAARQDVLLCFNDSGESPLYEVTEAMVARLRELPDGAGADAAWEAIQ